MSLRLVTLLVIVNVLFVLFIFLKVKKQKISIKYSLIWFASSFIMIFSALNYKTMKDLANFLGIETASNMVFFFLIGIMIIITFYMSATTSRLIDKTTILAEELAILKKEVNDDKQNKN